MANEEHLAILKQGVVVWNKWREKHPNEEPDLNEADLRRANLSLADLSLADLSTAHLLLASLVETNFENANLSDCRVYGISAWDLKLENAKQSNLIITHPNEPTITMDNLEVAQFIYLLLKNQEIRDVINTIGKKGVLILGRFFERKHILDAIREELRRRDYVPIVFDFERPTDRDFTETIMTLAGMSRFIIADITKPRSVPLELQATVPNYMIPFVPIIEEGEKPFSMFVDLQNKYDKWVLNTLVYDSVPNLVRALEDAVIVPALKKHDELTLEKAKELKTRHTSDYLSEAKAKELK